MSEIDQHPDWSEEAHEHICGLVNENETLRTALAASEARVRELEQLRDDIIDQTASDMTDWVMRTKAAESQLAKLREGLGGVLQECHKEARERVKTDEGYCINGAYQHIASRLEALITQTAPTVNSADGVNAGENNA